MKKILGILLAAVIALTSLTALAEAIDFSGYNDAELIELLASVQQEIANRHIEKSASLPQGTYLVGKDIPAGSYDISVVYGRIILTYLKTCPQLPLSALDCPLFMNSTVFGAVQDFRQFL